MRTGVVELRGKRGRYLFRTTVETMGGGTFRPLIREDGAGRFLSMVLRTKKSYLCIHRTMISCQYGLVVETPS